MARTLTNQIPLGFRAIDFNLPDVISDKKVNLKDVTKKKWIGSNVYLQPLSLCYSCNRSNCRISQ